MLVNSGEAEIDVNNKGIIGVRIRANNGYGSRTNWNV